LCQVAFLLDDQEVCRSSDGEFVALGIHQHFLIFSGFDGGRERGAGGAESNIGVFHTFADFVLEPLRAGFGLLEFESVTGGVSLRYPIGDGDAELNAGLIDAGGFETGRGQI
jgi:hypothetical protein